MDANRLTYHTLRWIFNTRRDKALLACQSPGDVKRLIWGAMKVACNGNTAAYLKGTPYVNVTALYEWVKFHRGEIKD